MKLFLVAGARPNFMKIAPIVRALRMHRDLRTGVGDQMSEVRGRRKKGKRMDEWMVAWLDDNCWDNEYAGMLAPVE